MPIDASQLDQLERDLLAAQANLEPRIRGRITTAMRQLLAVARGVVHVQSGDLRDSLYIIAPSIVAPEITESDIVARVSYDEQEADKGGAHDYPARTIEEGAAIIDRLTEDVAALIAQAFGVGRE